MQTKFKPRDNAELYLQSVGNMIVITYVVERKYLGGGVKAGKPNEIF
jgi:hypothetical protein